MIGNRILMSLITFYAPLLISCESGKIEENESKEIPHIVFYENGSLKESGMVIDGIAHGHYYIFLETGEKFREFFVKDGKLHGVQKWYSMGNLHYTETYVNGKRNGKAITFNPKCGYVIEEGVYKNNMREGLWYFYEKKKLLSVEYYKQDSLVEILYQSPQIEKQRYSIEDAPPPDDEDC